MESQTNRIITPDQALVAPIRRSAVKWERDPELNDLIAYFNEDRFFTKKMKTDQDRFRLLNAKEIEAIATIATRCKEDFTYAARNFFYITTEKRAEQLLVLKESQMLIYEHMMRLKARGLPMKIMLIKARRLGASTLCEAMIAWKTMFFKNVNAIVVSYDPAHAAYLFDMMQLIFDRMPWWLKPMISSRKVENGLVFSNPDYEQRRIDPGLGSRVMVQAANKRTGVGQGVRITAAHLCFSPDTLVITGDNTLKPICEVVAGDVAITSAGALTKVKGVYLSERKNEETAEIFPWGSPFPLSTTLDHRVLSPGGYREAAEFRKDDWLRIPVRAITSSQQSIVFPSQDSGGDAKTRDTRCVEHSVTAECSYELGWFFGMYLAEGSIGVDTRRPAEYQLRSVTLAIHRDEVETVLEATKKAIGEFSSPVAYRAKAGKSAAIRVNNSALARFTAMHFGRCGSKRIPDWVWGCGERFCLGILIGYLYGDGTSGQSHGALVAALSIRSAISVGMRALGVSLGYGWASLYFRPSGVYAARRCSESWTLQFSGRSAARLSALMSKGGRECLQRTEKARGWEYSECRKFIDVRVRTTSRGFSEEFYDLEVDAPEHNFCTLQACVANSEYSDWDQNYARELIEADLGPALAEEDPSMFAILESTAKGTGNYSYSLWNKNVELGDQAEWHPVFLPWFFESTRFLPPLGGWRPEPEEVAMRERIELDWTRCNNADCLQYHERYQKTRDITGDSCPTCKTGKLAPYSLTDGQLLWMQKKRKNAAKDEESQKALKQEQATTSESAFQSSGTPIFSENAYAFAASTVRPPLKEGFFDKNGKLHGCNPYDQRRSPFTNQMYQACYLSGCNVDHENGNGRGENPVKIWKEPERGAKYCIGADVAEGYGGKSDYSAACVIKINQANGADEQVAISRSNTTSTIEFAQVLNCLGRWYNDALMAPENNVFDTTVNELRYKLAYPNLYRMKDDRVISNISGKFGWRTQGNSKPRLYQTWNQRLGERLIIVRSRTCLEEMKTFVKDYTPGASSMKTGAGKGDHDDTLMASMISFYVAHENDWDENLGQLGSKQELTMEAAPWHWQCQKCNLEWPAVGSDEQQCPRCSCRVIQGRLNRDVSADDNQADPFAAGKIGRYQAQDYAEPMEVTSDSGQILDYDQI